MMAKQLKKDAQFDAAIIAGFGCGEASILQEMVPFPVIGLLEASLSTACYLDVNFQFSREAKNGSLFWKNKLKILA
ncbi:hypothetical protein U3C50_003933 [Providencia rettgeri]|nr:hypothetical protein [Providencia rettgeri]